MRPPRRGSPLPFRQRVYRAASLGCRRERDLEAFPREMAAVNRDELGA